MKKPKVPLTQERVREVLDVDIETGVVRWKIDFGGRGGTRHKAGKVINNKPNGSGYLRIGIDGILYPLHRVIWLWHYGEWPEAFVDHINRVKTDNRICNLRKATNQENNFNSSMNRRNRSGVKGVCCSTSRPGYYLVKARCKGSETRHIFSSYDLVEAVSYRLAVEEALGWDAMDPLTSAKCFMQRYLKGEL